MVAFPSISFELWSYVCLLDGLRSSVVCSCCSVKSQGWCKRQISTGTMSGPAPVFQAYESNGLLRGASWLSTVRLPWYRLHCLSWRRSALVWKKVQTFVGSQEHAIFLQIIIWECAVTGLASFPGLLWQCPSDLSNGVDSNLSHTCRFLGIVLFPRFLWIFSHFLPPSTTSPPW